jgi:hypothetical protein
LPWSQTFIGQSGEDIFSLVVSQGSLGVHPEHRRAEAVVTRAADTPLDRLDLRRTELSFRMSVMPADSA